MYKLIAKCGPVSFVTNAPTIGELQRIAANLVHMKSYRIQDISGAIVYEYKAGL